MTGVLRLVTERILSPLSRDLLILRLLKKSLYRFVTLPLLFCVAFLSANRPVLGADAPPADEELVDIKKIDPTIVVELRYAGNRNIAGRPLYPAGMPALVRASVAQRLRRAQAFLYLHHYRLKIWDAYRPTLAQALLWQLSRNGSYVADPSDGRGSLHTWGVAIDATMVDEKGDEVLMPTDFDAFTPNAGLHYYGDDRQVSYHLKLLQTAMRRGGFYGLRTEWWHFIAYDWKKFGPVHDQAFAPTISSNVSNFSARPPAAGIHSRSH